MRFKAILYNFCCVSLPILCFASEPAPFAEEVDERNISHTAQLTSEKVLDGLWGRTIKDIVMYEKDVNLINWLGLTYAESRQKLQRAIYAAARLSRNIEISKWPEWTETSKAVPFDPFYRVFRGDGQSIVARDLDSQSQDFQDTIHILLWRIEVLQALAGIGESLTPHRFSHPFMKFFIEPDSKESVQAHYNELKSLIKFTQHSKQALGRLMQESSVVQGRISGVMREMFPKRESNNQAFKDIQFSKISGDYAKETNAPQAWQRGNQVLRLIKASMAQQDGFHQFETSLKEHGLASKSFSKVSSDLAYALNLQHAKLTLVERTHAFLLALLARHNLLMPAAITSGQTIDAHWIAQLCGLHADLSRRWREIVRDLPKDAVFLTTEATDAYDVTLEEETNKVSVHKSSRRFLGGRLLLSLRQGLQNEGTQHAYNLDISQINNTLRGMVLRCLFQAYRLKYLSDMRENIPLKTPFTRHMGSVERMNCIEALFKVYDQQKKMLYNHILKDPKARDYLPNEWRESFEVLGLFDGLTEKDRRHFIKAHYAYAYSNKKRYSIAEYNDMWRYFSRNLAERCTIKPASRTDEEILKLIEVMSRKTKIMECVLRAVGLDVPDATQHYEMVFSLIREANISFQNEQIAKLVEDERAQRSTAKKTSSASKRKKKKKSVVQSAGVSQSSALSSATENTVDVARAKKSQDKQEDANKIGIVVNPVGHVEVAAQHWIVHEDPEESQELSSSSVTALTPEKTEDKPQSSSASLAIQNGASDALIAPRLLKNPLPQRAISEQGLLNQLQINQWQHRQPQDQQTIVVARGAGKKQVETSPTVARPMADITSIEDVVSTKALAQRGDNDEQLGVEQYLRKVLAQTESEKQDLHAKIQEMIQQNYHMALQLNQSRALQTQLALDLQNLRNIAHEASRDRELMLRTLRRLSGLSDEEISTEVRLTCQEMAKQRHQAPH